MPKTHEIINSAIDRHERNEALASFPPAPPAPPLGWLDEKKMRKYGASDADINSHSLLKAALEGYLKTGQDVSSMKDDASQMNQLGELYQRHWDKQGFQDIPVDSKGGNGAQFPFRDLAVDEKNFPIKGEYKTSHDSTSGVAAGMRQMANAHAPAGRIIFDTLVKQTQAKLAADAAAQKAAAKAKLAAGPKILGPDGKRIQPTQEKTLTFADLAQPRRAPAASPAAVASDE